jgi:hypothetical protein
VNIAGYSFCTLSNRCGRYSSLYDVCAKREFINTWDLGGYPMAQCMQMAQIHDIVHARGSTQECLFRPSHLYGSCCIDPLPRYPTDK